MYTYGMDWCTDVVGAQMWPPGEPQYAQPVLAEDGLFPRGCRCFNNAEAEILADKLPPAKYEEFVATIQEAARDECDFLVPPGWDHNCYDESDEGPAFIAPLPNVAGECVGDCGYTCDIDDPSPYECEGLVNADSGSDDGGESETGGPAFHPPRQGEIAWPQ